MTIRAFDPASVIAGPFRFSLSRGLFIQESKVDLPLQQELAVGNLMLDRGGGISTGELALLIGCRATNPEGTVKVVLSKAKRALATVGAELKVAHSRLEYWWWDGPSVKDDRSHFDRLADRSAVPDRWEHVSLRGSRQGLSARSRSDLAG